MAATDDRQQQRSDQSQLLGAGRLLQWLQILCEQILLFH